MWQPAGILSGHPIPPLTSPDNGPWRFRPPHALVERSVTPKNLPHHTSLVVFSERGARDPVCLFTLRVEVG